MSLGFFEERGYVKSLGSYLDQGKQHIAIGFFEEENHVESKL